MAWTLVLLQQVTYTLCGPKQTYSKTACKLKMSNWQNTAKIFCESVYVLVFSLSVTPVFNYM